MEVKIIIDNKEYLADSNETILQVAKRNGIEIPSIFWLQLCGMT